MTDFYNKVEHFKSFSLGDWVLRKVFPNKKEWMARKLGENLEGPYQIRVVTLGKAYLLKSIERSINGTNWNARHL